MSVMSIKVTPTVGEFSDVEPGMIFVIPFTIHNISNSVRRVRFGPPKTSAFRLINTQQSIAPGMKQVVEVEFSSKEVKEVHDTLVIKTEEGEVVIPLHAWFPAPNIVCDPVIELGRVSMQHPVESKRFQMKNIGKRDGVFKFTEEVALAGLSLVPPSGLVPAGKHLDVLVHYFPAETGQFRGTVTLNVEGHAPRLIEVTAEVLESRVVVTSKATNEPLSRVSFGKVFFGQSKESEILLRNFSEHTVSFTLRPLEEAHASESEEAATKNLLPIHCFPREGRILANGTAPVQIKFTPELTEAKRGWEHTSGAADDLAKSWDIPFVVEIVETEQQINLGISGKATPIRVSLSSSSFRFPDCAVNDHCDIAFTFANDNPELPVTFAFSRIAHFKCEPSRGTLGPKAEQSVLLSFQPNQLGSFKNTISLTVNDGVKRIPISVNGSSSSIDPRKPTIGGIDKVEEDFAKPLKLARTTSSAPAGQTLLLEGANPDGTGDERTAPELLLMSEWHQKAEHHNLYNNFVTNSRHVREYNEKLKKGIAVDTNPDDIGMVPGEGLDEPEPKMPIREDRLAWTAAAENAGAKGDGPSLRKALRVDENKLVKKKFRKEPANLNEMRECKLELSPTDIQNVITPIKVLDFQQVNVFSTNTKSFFIFNGLKTHILVQIPFQREELALSSPQSQVVPPGQMAGFDIVFRSETVQTFQQAIYFTINETHKLKFVVFAEAVPIDVQLSTGELQFRFPETGCDSSVSLPLTLTNNGNSNAEFQWGFPQGDTGAFVFSPNTGFVPARGSTTVSVSYTPLLAANETSSNASLKVKGSTSVKQVVLSGSVQASSCSWSVKDSRVDFKKIPVGSIRTQIITIKNSGSNSTVYAFDTASLTAGVTVVPPRGRVAGGASEEVTLQLKAAVSQSIKCQLSCNIRGMKQLLKAQVTAEAKVPDFCIPEPMEDDSGESPIDFGGVYVGSFELRRIQIQNNDDVVAYFLVDLTSYPQFSLYDHDKRPVEATSTDSDEIPVGVMGQVTMYKMKRDDDDDMHHDISRRGSVFRVGVTTHHSYTLYLAFAPKFVGAVERFGLPMSLAGSELTCDALKPIVVSGEGKKPRLVMTPSLVDFGSRVVVRDNTSKIPNRILVKLTNETDDDLQWDLEGKQAADADAFRVEPLAGRLLAGQSSQIQFTFTPLQVKAYSARYHVFLDGNHEVKYMDITSKGFGSNPCLTFDRKEVILPPVPVDVVTKTTFYVSNDGYESLDLRYKIAGDGKLPVTLNFPDGQTITSNHNVLPVDVIFSSKKPITFTVNIDFYDDADGIFSIPVTCTADSSILTTYSYVKSRDGSFTVAAEGDKKPLVYKESEDVNEKDTPRAASRDSGSTSGQTTGATEEANSCAFAMIDAVYKKTMTKRAVDRLRNWLNANLLPEPVDDLIATLQANQGRLASEIIELLFGKGPQAPPQQQKANSKKEGASAGTPSITEPLDTLLLFLKSYGGCVSEVRAEYLLKYEDYCKVGSEQAAKSGGGATAIGALASAAAGGAPGAKALIPTKPQRMPEKKFAVRAMHAWVTTIFQILKVFYFSRVTWKSFRALPTTPVFQQCASAEKWSSLQAEPTSTGSNLYSTSEGLLLKWLSIHALAVFGKRDDKGKKTVDGRLTNFEGDLRDCRAFAACLITYIPPLASRFDTTKENGFVANPVTATDFEKNASLLLDSMREYGMDSKITGREFLEFGGRDNVLFAAYLYSALPQYVPKTTIKFKGKLLEKITKQIELTNPTKWPIDYNVTLDGSDEFKASECKLHLEPKATGLFTITVVPRFSKKVEGRCMFLNAHGGTYSSATMIFQLETEIDTDSAIKTIDNLETPIYEPLNTEIWVENPFQSNGQYSVHVFQEYVKDGNAKPYPEEASLSLFPEAFWSPVDTLAIKRNDKTKFQLQFLPCVRGQYRARVVFKDEKVGEFAYLFLGNGQPPKPYESISLQTEAAIAASRELTVPFRNSALEKALLQKDERFKVFKGPRKTNQAKETHDDGKEVVYKLEFVNDQFVGPNPFYSGPKSFTLKSEGKDPADAEAKRKALKDKQQGQLFNVSFVPKGPGTYNGFLILSSSWDIRVIAVEGKSRSPGIKAELEFNCPARQQIMQEIPITNSSDKEWVIAAQLTGEYFAGARELRIPSGRTKAYQLQFNPTWVCDSVGQLILRNNDTQERYTYTLRGKAEEPLAENTIPVECKARETRKITINVPNITFDEVTYTVETDLPFVSGNTKITVGKMEVGKFVLNLAPQISGKTTGSITFIAPNKQYLWFVLQLTVLRPPPEDTITINAEVRKGAVAEIAISNPTKQMVDFTVRRRGDGLLGDDIFTLEPQKSGLYQLAFAPARSGTSEGVVSFNNDDIGEFWYKLVLVARDAAPMSLNMQCEIGKNTTAEIVLDNPLDMECVMTLANTNDVNFTVSPQQLVMRPNGLLKITVSYIPSAIQSGQEAILKFSHPQAGTWECKCRGTGLPPTKMETVTCTALVGRMASVSVNFRNPFPLPRKFIFTLKSEDPTAFSLMQKKQVSTLAPFQSLTVAASYSPSSIASHKASVVVQQADQVDGGDLKWEYPLLGTAESVSLDPPSKLICKARKELQTVLGFPLVGLSSDVDSEELSTELIFSKDAQYARAASNSLTIKRVDATQHGGKIITLRDGTAAQSAYFQFVFAPLRPFTTAAEVCIKKASGGQWRFPIALDVASPDSDDVIVMEAAVNAVATVSFQLYNVLPQASPFTAHFSAESPQEFSVVPIKGTLPPIAASVANTRNSGQQLSVSFTSSQYGKTLVGYLVVDTEEMQWRYEVRGTLPKYQPPTNVSSKVSSRLRPESEAALRKANGGR